MAGFAMASESIAGKRSGHESEEGARKRRRVRMGYTTGSGELPGSRCRHDLRRVCRRRTQTREAWVPDDSAAPRMDRPVGRGLRARVRVEGRHAESRQEQDQESLQE